MRHFKHNYAVVQHLVVKIPTIITIGEIMNNKKPSNSLNLLGLFENTGGDESCHLYISSHFIQTH